MKRKENKTMKFCQRDADGFTLDDNWLFIWSPYSIIALILLIVLFKEILKPLGVSRGFKIKSINLPPHHNFCQWNSKTTNPTLKKKISKTCLRISVSLKIQTIPTLSKKTIQFLLLTALHKLWPLSQEKSSPNSRKSWTAMPISWWAKSSQTAKIGSD